MQRRCSIGHLIIALMLAPLMVVVDTQAQITFISARDGHVHPMHGWPIHEIYVMDVDGNNQRRLTNNPSSDISPSWAPGR